MNSSASSSAGTSQRPSLPREAFTRLRAVFPSIDPVYLERCIQSHLYAVDPDEDRRRPSSSPSSPSPSPSQRRRDGDRRDDEPGDASQRAPSPSPSQSPRQHQIDKLVHKVTTKILDANHGYYPTVLFRDITRRKLLSPAKGGAGGPKDARVFPASQKSPRRWKLSGTGSGTGRSDVLEGPRNPDAKGKAKEELSGGSSRKGKERAMDHAFDPHHPTLDQPPHTALFNQNETLLQVDQTATRNVALIRLNEMFPSVALSHLRSVLTRSNHSYIHQALARLLRDSTLAPDSPELWLDDGEPDEFGSPHPSSSLAHTAAARGRSGAARRRNGPELVALPKRENPGEITLHDLIRDQDYIDSALRLLNSQFPNLWKSSLKAVMVENNFDYAMSFEAASRLERERAKTILGRAWDFLRNSFAPTPVPSSSHTLSAPPGAAKTGTMSSEKTGIVDLRDIVKDPSSVSDLDPTLLYELHLHLTEDTAGSTDGARAGSREASVTGTVADPSQPTTLESTDLECGCCFCDLSADEVLTCASGCVFCKTCIARAVEETVYGQAPLQLHRDTSTSAGPHLSRTGAADGQGAPTPVTHGYGGEGMGIRCLSIEGCPAPFSDPVLRQTLPEELYKSLEERIASEVLRSIESRSSSMMAQTKQSAQSDREKIRVVKCPFCSYAEVQAVPQLSELFRGRKSSKSTSFLDHLNSFVNAITVGIVFLMWILACLLFFDVLNESSTKYTRPPDPLRDASDEAIYFPLDPLRALHNISGRVRETFETIHARRNGTVFHCKNLDPLERTESSSSSSSFATFASPAYIHSLLPPPPPRPAKMTRLWSKRSASKSAVSPSYCGRSSCLLCQRLYYPGHDCNDSTEGLRLAMESAASNAVKRQCPECLLSFVKLDGCNKVVCRCGYAMCFVCRKGIGAERYSHFCQHVRDPPGSPCTACSKCDLYKVEDDVNAAQKAADEAKREWLQAHPDVDADTAVRYGAAGRNVSGISDPYDVTLFVLQSLESFTEWTLNRLVF